MKLGGIKIFIYAIAAKILAVTTAVLEAGAGHGSYAAARPLFPFTLLSARFYESITTPFIALGVIQYPLYGLIWAVAVKTGKSGLIIGLLAMLHVSTVIASFALPNPSFPN